VAAELKKTTEALSAQINQLKAEFNRKISNVAPQPAPKPQKRFEEEFYEDADRAIENVMAKTEEKTTEKVLQAIDRRDQIRETQNKLFGEFPELQDASSPLYKKADEIYRSFGIPENQLDPRALRAAVNEAALDLGVAPKSKRQKESSSDDFTGLSGGSAPKGGSRSKSKVTEGMMVWAQQMGLDTKDPKVIERLEQRAQRKNWLKYE
jgi:hypothetical protein